MVWTALSLTFSRCWGKKFGLRLLLEPGRWSFDSTCGLT
jgi:hypothetical protein